MDEVAMAVDIQLRRWRRERRDNPKAYYQEFYTSHLRYEEQLKQMGLFQPTNIMAGRPGDPYCETEWPEAQKTYEQVVAKENQRKMKTERATKLQDNKDTTGQLKEINGERVFDKQKRNDIAKWVAGARHHTMGQKYQRSPREPRENNINTEIRQENQDDQTMQLVHSRPAGRRTAHRSTFEIIAVNQMLTTKMDKLRVAFSIPENKKNADTKRDRPTHISSGQRETPDKGKPGHRSRPTKNEGGQKRHNDKDEGTEDCCSKTKRPNITTTQSWDLPEGVRRAAQILREKTGTTKNSRR